MKFLIILIASLTCDGTKDFGGTIVEQVTCPAEIVDCGHVYVCGVLELCINDEHFASAETQFGMCLPTARHQGLCIYCCGAQCGAGCNAFHGCWCP